MKPFFTVKKLLKVKLQNFQKQVIVIDFKIPYFAQWESPNLIEKIINKKVSAKSDPNWRNSGAKTKEEYELWSWNSCGMACFKMILFYLLKKNVPIVTLGKKCLEYGGYKGTKLEGLYYYPFLEFIKKEYNLSGKVISPMTIFDIANEMKKGSIIIASVSHLIRDETKTGEKGGHLVLITGINTKNKTITLHNPSGIDLKTQENFKTTMDNFEKHFAYRGIVVYS